ncbi:hypothetical protein [Herbaspirillum sp. RV1423]|uniref:hypothetical protein n=1 Tax=Herbaspirillum sp. RV1423 TaxID=1443993 RepID=UPI0006857C2B|nr:hypothetical protein [Herbaspirillum sp. RV1423]
MNINDTPQEQAPAKETISLNAAANLALNALHECKPFKGSKRQISDAIRALTEALRDIAFTTNLTATPKQFVRHLQNTAKEALAQEQAPADKDAEIARLNAIINTPQSGDFLRAVSIESEHQRQRWGSAHDAGKTAADWFWLIGYLAGKALHAHAAENMVKTEHHIITTAAALMNWHLSLSSGTDMRPGIDGELALQSQPLRTTPVELTQAEKDWIHGKSDEPLIYDASAQSQPQQAAPVVIYESQPCAIISDAMKAKK